MAQKVKHTDLYLHSKTELRQLIWQMEQERTRTHERYLHDRAIIRNLRQENERVSDLYRGQKLIANRLRKELEALKKGQVA